MRTDWNTVPYALAVVHAIEPSCARHGRDWLVGVRERRCGAFSLPRLSGTRRACRDRRFIPSDISRKRIANVNIRHTPASVAAPFGPYSHAVEVPEGSRLLYISGEVGVLPDGTVPENIEAQAEACWRNIIAILGDAGMGIEDLVKITTYLVRPEDVAAAGAARAKHFADARPGSATIIVKALVNPAWLIEIEAVAAASAR
jgi:2-iminobutanoate/2-iminopropanoate deaminase